MADWSDIDFYAQQADYIEKMDLLVSRAEAARTLVDTVDGEVQQSRSTYESLSARLSEIQTLVSAMQTFMEGASAFDQDNPVSTNQLNLLTLDAALSSSTDILDVFVYDVRLDRDGGQWRKQCQGTSWYGETLDTSTRGVKADFPAVLAIVVESDRAVLYDLTEPAFPMWMIFTYAGGAAIRTGTVVVKARNGKIYAGGASGVTIVDFLADRGSYLYNTSGQSIRADARISARNSSITYELISGSTGIVSNAVNDIAVHTQDEAQLDPATRLPIDLLAVGTDSGVSVCYPDTAVVDVLGSGVISNVQFVVRGLAVYQQDSRLCSIFHHPLTASQSRDERYDEVGGLRILTTAVGAYAGEIAGTNPIALTTRDGTNDTGLLIIHRNPKTASDGMYSRITSAFATPYQMGIAKLCLSGDSLTDRSVVGTSVNDAGTATFAAVATGTSLQATTASGGDLTATVTTGGECYGWEQVSGVWYFRRQISDWVGVAESGGTLTIDNGTIFTRLVYTTDTPTANQLDVIEAVDRPLFAEDVQHLLAGSSDAVLSVSDDPVIEQIHAITSYGRSTFDSLVRSSDEATVVGTLVAVSAADGAVVQAGATGADADVPERSLRDELNRVEEKAGQTAATVQQFDQSSGVSDTDFWLEPGWLPVSVYWAASGNLDQVPTDDYILTADGFRRGVVFDSAPGTGTVGIIAARVAA